jgi:hypothetical protein
LNTKPLPDLRGKASVFINLAFNMNIEILSLVCMDMGSDSLSTLRRFLSTIDASNHIHHMELHVETFVWLPKAPLFPVSVGVYISISGLFIVLAAYMMMMVWWVK